MEAVKRRMTEEVQLMRKARLCFETDANARVIIVERRESTDGKRQGRGLCHR